MHLPLSLHAASNKNWQKPEITDEYARMQDNSWGDRIGECTTVVTFSTMGNRGCAQSGWALGWERGGLGCHAPHC